ncbi:MAG: LytS/YhcK type 5TM receptor domain-containing protein [Candidatus Methylumidiphilus sp.]
MESLELDTLWQWFGYTAQLVQRVCLVVVAAFACIHLSWVRRALRGRQKFGWQGLMMGLLFGLFAIIATHSGILLDIGEHNVRTVDWFAGGLFAGLGEYQVVLGFRDTMVLTAGLVGGPWVGLIAGMLAGYERFLLGGFAHIASGSATVILGACPT